MRYTKLNQDPVESSDPASPSDQPPSSPGEPVGGKNELRVFQGPAGLIVTSDDPQLLNEFDEISRVVQEQMASGPSEPTVIYLKHISALAAEELIRGVLSGASSGGGGSAGGGGLLGEVASSVLGGGGFLGSLLGMGGGGGSAASSSTSTSSGEVSITADPRLNALWVQANPLDMQLIEELIQIIDTDNSPVDPQTRGTPNIIYLQNASVTEVETTVRSVFADRLGGAAGAQNAQRPPSPQEFIEALRGGGGGGGRRGAAPKELKESTMTITSDKKNNSLIVVAPKQLFEQVEEFVTMLDKTAEGSEDSFVVAPIAGINPNTVRSALSSVFGAQARTSSTTNPQTSAPANSSQPQANPFQAFRNFNPGAFGGGNAGGGMQMGFPNAAGGNPGMMFGVPGMGGQGGGQGFRGMQGGGGNPFGGMGGAGGGFGGNRGGFGGGNTGGGNTGGGNTRGGNTGGGNRSTRGNR